MESQGNQLCPRMTTRLSNVYFFSEDANRTCISLHTQGNILNYSFTKAEPILDGKFEKMLNTNYYFH